MYFKQTEKISLNIQNKFSINLFFDTCCSKNVNFRKSTAIVQHRGSSLAKKVCIFNIIVSVHNILQTAQRHAKNKLK